MRENEKLKREFQIDEFKFLTQTILFHAENQTKLEQYTLLGIAAIYGWLLTRPSPRALPNPGDLSSLGVYIFWLPPLLVVFAALRSASLLFTLELTYAYIKKIEISLTGGPGWQAFVVDYRRKNPQMWLFRLSLVIFWIAMLVFSLALAWHFAPLHSL